MTGHVPFGLFERDATGAGQPSEMPGEMKRPRIVVSELAPVGDERSAKLVASLLRDVGVEVIYTGRQGDPVGIVETAIQEDADAVALSVLSAEHMALIPPILRLLHADHGTEVRVLVFGTISAADATELRRLGVADILRSRAAIEHVGTLLRCQASRTRPCA